MAEVWPFIGRAGELAAIERALEETGGAIVAGPAGVGKSRLVSEAASALADRGVEVVRCFASRSAQSVPLGAFAALMPGSAPLNGPEMVAVACHQLVSRIGRDGVLAVDDAHALDEVSAAVLHQLAGARGLKVLLTLRTDEQAPDAVTALWKDDLVARIDIAALSPEDCRVLIETQLDGPLSDESAKRLFEVASGNPLLLRELIVAARDFGDLRLDGQVWIWSGRVVGHPRLSAVVAAHLDRIDAGVRRLIELVALHEPLALARAVELCGETVVESAERRNLVTVDGDGNTALAHPLYGEIVRAELPLVTRRRHVEDIAQVVLAQGPPPEDEALRLAVLHREAGLSAPVPVLLAAARRALHLADPALAENLAEAATITDPACFEAAFSRAEAILRQGEPERAAALFAGLAGSESSPDEIVQLARAHALAVPSADPGNRLAIIDEALARVETEDHRDVLRTVRAEVAMRFGDLRAALEQAEAVFAETRSLVARLHAAEVITLLEGVGRRPESAAALAESLLPDAFAVAATESEAPLVLSVARWLGLLMSGQPTAATEFCASLLEAMPPGAPGDLGTVLHLLAGRTEVMRGRPRTAARWLDQAIDALRVADVNGFLGWALGLRAEASAVAGDHSAAASWAAASEQAGPSFVWPAFDLDRIRALAWVRAADGELSAAAEPVAFVARFALARGSIAWGLVGLHEVLRFGDATAAAEIVAVAHECEGPMAAAIAARARAVISGGAADYGAAGDLFAESGLLLPAAECLAAAAHAFGEEGYHAAAQSARARAATLAAACEGARSPALPGGTIEVRMLTRREREVAEMAARGASNREIAERLFASVRTVEGHLLRAYAKLGVTKRSDLAETLGLAPGENA